MAKINCDVTNCSHNKSNTCFANRINVSGGNADKECETCCATFLDKALYSTLTNNTNDYGKDCSAIVCDVKTCYYNENKLCTADSINVFGENVNLYEETNCGTFKKK